MIRYRKGLFIDPTLERERGLFAVFTKVQRKHKNSLLTSNDISCNNSLVIAYSLDQEFILVTILKLNDTDHNL